MRTLHKLFHENLFKKWLFALVISLVGGLLISKGIQKKIDNNMAENAFLFFGYIATFGGPFAIFFMNLFFVKNIKLLINRSFSKMELIKFYYG